MSHKVINIRPAIASDCAQILIFIKGLADYEKLAHEVVASEDDLRRTLFADNPSAEVVIAEFDRQPAGFALFFTSYSTFLARPGIYLEDLFVLPDLRGNAIGKAQESEEKLVEAGEGGGQGVAVDDLAGR